MNKLLVSVASSALLAGVAWTVLPNGAAAQSGGNQQMYDPNAMMLPDQQAAARFTYGRDGNSPNRQGSVGTYRPTYRQPGMAGRGDAEGSDGMGVSGAHDLTPDYAIPYGVGPNEAYQQRQDCRQ